MSTGLYGIFNSNRSEDAHWGKNCFNSSYPTALACYMMDHDIKAVYIRLAKEQGKLKVIADQISFRQVFNCKEKSPKELRFDFESVYTPYQKYSFSHIDPIDLVVKDINGGFLSPLEVKLTVLPTDATSRKPEKDWGCEMVIRSATTSYCALGMFDSTLQKSSRIREIFERACSDIQMWDNDFEMTHKTPHLCECIDVFQYEFLQYQKPLLMQTIWKTKGKNPLLADHAFDVIVWSDYAFSRLFIDSSYMTAKTMSRPMRATARLARCLWELSKSGKIQISNIYRQMAFGNQTDKEFAISGQKWRNYVTSDRVIQPILPKDVIKDIIEDGFIDRLSPERRFDQTLYFTVRT